MSQRILELIDGIHPTAYVFTYILFLITGAFGGSVAATLSMSRGKKLGLFFLAYVFVGAVFGVLAALVMFSLDATGLITIAAIEAVYAASIAMGFAGSLTLLSLNVISRVAVSWQGMKLDITLRHDTEERRRAKDDA